MVARVSSSSSVASTLPLASLVTLLTSTCNLEFSMNVSFPPGLQVEPSIALTVKVVGNLGRILNNLHRVVAFEFDRAGQGPTISHRGP